MAAELGLTRITASDAIDSLAAQIEQAAGDSTWLAREAWDRLRTAGGKWGIELEVIDELIDEKLAANKAETYRRRFWTRTTLGVAAGGAALVAVIIAILVIIRANQSPETPPETPADGECRRADHAGCRLHARLVGRRSLGRHGRRRKPLTSLCRRDKADEIRIRRRASQRL